MTRTRCGPRRHSALFTVAELNERLADLAMVLIPAR